MFKEVKIVSNMVHYRPILCAPHQSSEEPTLKKMLRSTLLSQVALVKRANNMATLCIITCLELVSLGGPV